VSARLVRKGAPVLRRATLRDLDLLVRHRRAMWAAIEGLGFTEAELDAADPVFRRWVQALMRGGTLVGWIVDVGGIAAASGCVWLQPVQPRPRWPHGREPYLLSMFTEPAFRGRGLAKRIVRAATTWAKEEGYTRFTLHASPMGRPVYQALGWEVSSEMKIDPRTGSKRKPARRR
jgi:GNAT superfamily N-acetyltransferase